MRLKKETDMKSPIRKEMKTGNFIYKIMSKSS